MPAPKTTVIVGASLAGGTAAATLRDEGYDGRIVLIGEEPRPPYERPPLSKEYLRGEQPFERALVRPEAWWQEHGVETRFGMRAERLDPAAREILLADGERMHYDAVLIATGGRNRRLPLPGLDLAGVHDLRTVEDADRIRAEIGPGRRAVIVGMGFIGAEVAASLRQEGVEVEVVEVFKAPLFRVLGEEVGRVFEGIHRDHGVRMHFEDTVAAFEGESRVERVRTTNGLSIPCDFAVVGVGIEPVVDVIAGTGIEVDDGVVVDERCRTSADGVFAAGDVTRHWHPVFERRIRVEHWQNALKQGEAAARSMLGHEEPYAEVHWFWSDQYEHNLQYAGFHTEWDELVVRGSLEQRNFAAFYVKDGVVQAVVGLDRGKDVRRARSLIAARTRVDPAILRDEDVDLRTLAG